MEWYLIMAVICISLMANGIEYPFMRSFAILWWNICVSLAHFLIGFFFSYWVLSICIHIPDTSPLLYMVCKYFFSVTCPLILSTSPLVEQMLLINIEEV